MTEELFRDAPCQSDPELWFPEGSAPAQEWAAARICASCGWRPECANRAAVIRPQTGIWAGARWTDRKSRKITPPEAARVAGAAHV